MRALDWADGGGGGRWTLQSCGESGEVLHFEVSKPAEFPEGPPVRAQLAAPEGCGDAPWASWTMKVGWAVQGAPAALLDGALAQLARVDGVPRTRPSGAEAGLCDSVLPLSPDAVS